MCSNYMPYLIAPTLHGELSLCTCMYVCMYTTRVQHVILGQLNNKTGNVRKT